MKLNKNIQTSLAIIAFLWLVYFLNFFIPGDFRFYGIQPRNINHLWGIVCSPFLHGNLSHLIANSSALAVLLVVSLAFSRKLTFWAILIIGLVGGGSVWLFGGSNTVHIGASGVIFGLIGFLMFLGIFRHEWKALVFSIIVFLLYGGALFSLLLYIPGISWSAHFYGFFSGILAAWWLRAWKK